MEKDNIYQNDDDNDGEDEVGDDDEEDEFTKRNASFVNEGNRDAITVTVSSRDRNDVLDGSKNKKRKTSMNVKQAQKKLSDFSFRLKIIESPKLYKKQKELVENIEIFKEGKDLMKKAKRVERKIHELNKVQDAVKRKYNLGFLFDNEAGKGGDLSDHDEDHDSFDFDNHNDDDDSIVTQDDENTFNDSSHISYDADARGRSQHNLPKAGDDENVPEGARAMMMLREDVCTKCSGQPTQREIDNSSDDSSSSSSDDSSSSDSEDGERAVIMLREDIYICTKCSGQPTQREVNNSSDDSSSSDSEDED